jgi:hypothetical protein
MPVERLWTVVVVSALTVAAAVRGAAQRVDTTTPLSAPKALRPLASLLIPGAGQLMGGQDRGAVYLATEIYLVSRFIQLDREASRDARQFQALAFDIARRAYNPTTRDTVFEYYEQMERFAESGRYNTDPGTGFTPESDTRTYNGSVWLLARRTFWPDPDVLPDPTSLEYWRAVDFYQARAVGPGYQWSWRDHSLEHEVFKETIRRSDDGFRRAQNQVGLLLANHVVSAVDALISSRLAAVAGRPASLHTTVGARGTALFQFSIAF